MMRHIKSKAVLGLALAVAIAMVLAVQTGTIRAEDTSGNVDVGTFNPEMVFQQHPAQADLMSMMDSLQAEMEEAQMEGDQQRMQQLQQQFEQQRMQSINRFQDDLDAAMPQVAESADVKVIAVEVMYTTDDVQTKDITQDVLDAVADAPSMEGMPPTPAPGDIPPAPPAP